MRRDRCRYRGEKRREEWRKNCFPEGRVGKGKVSSYHCWIHLVRTRYESWIDFFEDRTIELDSIVNYIFIVWELIDIIIREDGIEFIMRDPYVVQFIPFYIDYLVKNLNDTHPFQRTASNWFELAIRIVISLLSIFPNRNRHSFSRPIGSSSTLRSLFLQNASFVRVSNTESSLQLSSNLA